jgi:hypothetical protein
MNDEVNDKILGMLDTCHRDLVCIIDSMGNIESLSNAHLLNLYLFKSLDSEILLWSKNIDNCSVLTLACRNIFELYLILLEVNKSEKSLKRFFAQLDSDRIELNSAFINKCKASEYPISDTNNKVLNEVFSNPSFPSLDGVETHGFRMKALAKNHGYLEDYDFFYKLSSKLIHPSAMKVFGIDEDIPFYDVISMAGYYFVSKATDFSAVFHNEHIASKFSEINT